MASFVLRRIDDALWTQFCAKAASDGYRPKEMLLRLVAASVHPQPTSDAAPELLADARQNDAAFTWLAEQMNSITDNAKHWDDAQIAALAQDLRIGIERNQTRTRAAIAKASALALLLIACLVPTAAHAEDRPSGKALTIGPSAVAAALLHKSGHRKVAAALGYGGGVVGASIGALNLSRSCGGAR